MKLIATGLLFVTAPRIKRSKDYWMEEETRAIIPLPVPSYNTLIEGYDETISKFGLGPTELRTLVAYEHTRLKDNGSTVFYREMYLPIHLLKGVYVKNEATKEEVGGFFAEVGLDVSDCIQWQVLVLVMSDWPHDDHKGVFSRQECITLNGDAEEIVNER